jgi:hypothetical protein
MGILGGFAATYQSNITFWDIAAAGLAQARIPSSASVSSPMDW